MTNKVPCVVCGKDVWCTQDEHALVEPEVVTHWLCPKGDRTHGHEAPAMTLTQRLDDEAGRQRRYVCPKCGMEITVNFPPEPEPMEEK